MIDPAFFGCSSKLPFRETVSLANALGAGDYSVLGGDPEVLLSIDRVSRCSADWATYADIAINHVTSDIEVGGASPIQLLISFEFGPDAETESEHAAASLAFEQSAQRLGVPLGKRHSAVGYNPTTVTIAAVGQRKRLSRGTILPNDGAVFLSRRLGYFKMHYMREMGLTDDGEFTSCLTMARQIRINMETSFLATDVSGYGLAGALLDLAARASVDIEVSLSGRDIASPAVLEIPIECLENPRSDFPDNLTFGGHPAERLALLKETYGPFLVLGYEDTSLPPFEGGDGLLIGSFRTGQGRVRVEWQG